MILALKTKAMATDFDNIRDRWSAANSRLDRLDSEVKEMGRKITDNRITTARQRLIRKLTRMAIISVVMIVVWLPYCLCSEIFAPGGWRLAMAIVGMVFFVTAAGLDWNLLYRLKGTDPAALPVNEVALRTRAIKKMHLLSIAILAPMAACTIWLLIMSLPTDETVRTELLVSLGAGAAIGLAIGLRILRGMLRDYRQIIDDFD